MADARFSRWNTNSKWPDMTASQKAAFVGKLVIMIVTFGFAFPRLLAKD